MEPTPGLGLSQPQVSQYLGHLLQTIPIGVVTVDSNGVVLAWNREAASILSDGTEDPLDIVVYDYFPSNERLRALVEDCFKEGEEQPPEILERDKNDERQYVEVQIRSVPEGSEEPIAIILLSDMTARTAIERRLKREVLDREFLAQTGTVLASSLDYRVTLTNLCRLVVSYLAEWCTINVVGEDGSIARAGVAHVDPAKEALVSGLQDRFPHDPQADSGVPLVLRRGDPLLVSEVTDEIIERTAKGDDYVRIIREIGTRSLMVLPLEAHGERLGTITLASAKTGRYGETELELAKDVAQRAAVAIYNARLFGKVQESRERFASLARTLQSSLLPPELPNIPGVEMAAFYRAGKDGLEVGGDFYDVFDLGNGEWGAVMGDVQGHGAAAAAVTALARYTLRAAALRLTRPAHALFQVNRALLRQDPEGPFLSVAFARFLPGKRPEVTIASAGHPLPLIVRTDGRVETVGGHGMLLGLFPAPDLSERPAQLDPGDAMLLYTDGVIESGAPDHMLGERGLAAILERAAGSSAQAIVTAISDVLDTAEAQGGHRDDCAALVLRVLPED